jgi:hypothetical protein
MPSVKLQQHTIMPFIIMQQVHMLPASIVHRFCIMLRATLSSQTQVIFIPPLQCSILKVHRGTIIKFPRAGIAGDAPIWGAPMPGAPMPCIAIPARSIIMLDIDLILSFLEPLCRSSLLCSPNVGRAPNGGIIKTGSINGNEFAGKNYISR